MKLGQYSNTAIANQATQPFASTEHPDAISSVDVSLSSSLDWSLESLRTSLVHSDSSPNCCRVGSSPKAWETGECWTWTNEADLVDGRSNCPEAHPSIAHSECSEPLKNCLLSVPTESENVHQMASGLSPMKETDPNSRVETGIGVGWRSHVQSDNPSECQVAPGEFMHSCSFLVSTKGSEASPVGTRSAEAFNMRDSVSLVNHGQTETCDAGVNSELASCSQPRPLEAEHPFNSVWSMRTGHMFCSPARAPWLLGSPLPHGEFPSDHPLLCASAA
jgi:hypothetical protein